MMNATNSILEGNPEAVLEILNSVDIPEAISQDLRDAQMLIVQNVENSGCIPARLFQIMQTLGCLADAFLASAVNNKYVAGLPIKKKRNRQRNNVSA